MLNITDPLISPTEEAVTLDPTILGARQVTYQIMGTLAVGESIVFEIEDGLGDWRTLTIDDTEVQIILGNDQVTFFGPAYIRIKKSATEAVCGLRALAL